MASLKKPVSCECGSINFRKDIRPERWTCIHCDKVCAERPTRNDPTKCRDCGCERGSKPFKKGKNLCLDCNSKYNSDYRAENRDVINAQQKEWQEKNKERYRKQVRENAEKNMSNWLRCRMGSIRRVRLQMKNGTQRATNSARLDIQIDHAFLIGLYKQQSGKCVITGLVMTCKHDCHFAASVDRKDNSVGYVPGNVQLVCQAVNYAKNRHTDSSIMAFFEEFAKLRTYGSQCRCTMGRHDAEEVQCPLHWSEAIRSRMVDD